MDRADLSSAIIQEMQALVGEALEAVVPELLTADLATLKQRAQQVGRVILGQLVERVATGHAQLLPRPACCAACGGQLKRRERPRPLVGLVGDYARRTGRRWRQAATRSRRWLPRRHVPPPRRRPPFPHCRRMWPRTPPPRAPRRVPDPR